MRVVDQDTGEEFNLWHTAELGDDLRSFHASTCSHQSIEIRRRINKAGALTFINQCLTCGTSVGQTVRKADAPAQSPDWNNSLEDAYRSKREAERKKIYQIHVRLQRAQIAAHDEKYAAYLSTDQWKAIRKKVMQRAKGICEGCLETPANEVHHLTYDHLYNEFMFELVAVCTECHDRIHPDKRGNKEQNYDISEWGDEHPCDACRWSGSHEHQRWCDKLDQPAKIALAVDGECGPERKELEGLR